MLFTEFRFAFFFALVFVVYWSLPGERGRKRWLLAASYAFYAAWDWRFLTLIWVSTLVDYTVGRRLSREQDQIRRRTLVIASLVVNLGLLGYFKYAGFFVSSAGELASWLGLPTSEWSLSIILPVGISFYTFQTLSYTIDVYRRRLAATDELLDFALFVGFFPQLVAGPIVRATEFLPQLRGVRRWDRVPIRAAVALLVVGYFQKAVVADNAAAVVDQYFASPADFTWLSGVTGVVAYAIQIYGDFAGYSNMAIGCAALLGFALPPNFDFPYLAPNLTDFWRRWHMTLSRWLRDYLYIALGGNRGSRLFTYRNVMLTMLLGGLWHGAAWRFVIWGGLHGVGLIAHREWRRRRGDPRPGWAPRMAATGFTFWWVCGAWVLFRAPDLTTAGQVLRTFVLFDSPGPRHLTALDGNVGLGAIIAIVIGLALAHIVASRGDKVWRRGPDWAFSAGLGAVIPLTWALVPTVTEPFIYFQF